jgi:hypothetical protein
MEGIGKKQSNGCSWAKAWQHANESSHEDTQEAEKEVNGL